MRNKRGRMLGSTGDYHYLMEVRDGLQVATGREGRRPNCVE